MRIGASTSLDGTSSLRENTTFAVLAGGFSRRMGQDKALLPLGGEPLIQRILGRGRLITDHQLVITNHPEAYSFLNVPLVRDMLEIQGPLVGLYTALCISQTPYLILTGCDMPWINPELLVYQLQLVHYEAWDVVIPKHEGTFEPLHAVYRRDTCLKAVETALEVGDRSLVGWLSRVRVREIGEDEVHHFDPTLRCFLNLNTPDEYHSMMTQINQ